MMKFLNLKCIIQYVGSNHLVVYNFEQSILYVINATALEVTKCMTVKDLNLMSLNDDGVVYLTKDNQDGAYVIQFLKLEENQEMNKDIFFELPDLEDTYKYLKTACVLYSFVDGIIGIGWIQGNQQVKQNRENRQPNRFRFFKMPKKSKNKKGQTQKTKILKSNFEELFFKLENKDGQQILSENFRIKICHTT